MNICVFYYDGFCEAEIVMSIWNGKLHREHNVFSAAVENRVYISEERQKLLPHKTIDELNPDDIDLFIIPGGDPSSLYENSNLKDFIVKLNKKNKYIAGICGGSELMAKFGVLDNKNCTGDGSGIKPDADFIHLFDNCNILNENIVIDRNTITATGQSFVEFAIEIWKIVGLYDNEEDYKEYYEWLKNIKN